MVAAPAQGCGVPWAIALLRFPDDAGRRLGVAVHEHGVLLEQAVEADHAGDGAAQRRGDLRRRRVDDDTGPVGRLDRLERCAQRGRDDGGGTAHRQQGAPGRGCPHGQSLAPQHRGHLRHLRRARAELGGVLGGRQVVAVVGRPRRGHGGDRLGETGGVLPGEDHVEVQHLAGRHGSELRTSAGTLGAACGRTTRGIARGAGGSGRGECSRAERQRAEQGNEQPRLCDEPASRIGLPRRPARAFGTVGCRLVVLTRPSSASGRYCWDTTPEGSSCG